MAQLRQWARRAVHPARVAQRREHRWLGRRTLALSCGGMVLLLTAAACGGSAANKTTPTSQGPSTLTIDEANNPSTMDPGLQYDQDTIYIYRNIFDQLIQRNTSTLKIEPMVATAWSNPSPNTWKFTIRQGIKFTNSEALTAQDVAFSLNRILDPSFASPQFSNYSYISNVSAAGSTVTITTKAPTATILDYLANLSIVPEHYVQQVGNAYFKLHPIGSGPYKMVSWIQGTSVTLASNNSYWGGKPLYKTVVYRAVSSEETRLSDVESGVADIAVDMTPADAVTAKGNSSVKVIATPTEAVGYLAFNALGAGEPTQSLQVRQAIIDALNYNQLIADVEDGYAKPTNSVSAPPQFGYDASLAGPAYNPTEAKSLLAQYGNPHPVLTFATSPVYPATLIAAVQAELEAVGFTVNIVSTDQPTYLSKVQSPSHAWGSIRYGAWDCTCGDVDGTLYPLFHTGSIWASYSNPQFDNLVQEARSTLNSAQRQAYYAQAYQALAADPPGVGLFQIETVDIVNPHISWNPGAQETLHLQQITWS